MAPAISSATAASRPSFFQEESSCGVPFETIADTDAKPSDIEIQRKPWKFVGYSGYAKFIASDDDFFVLRRFNTLSARIALSLQDEICVLEESLNTLDTELSGRGAQDFDNGTFRGDMGARRDLLAKISEKMRKYNEFILQQSSLRKYPRASSRDVESVSNWHCNHDSAAITAEERKYLNDEDDLIYVVQKDKTPLRQVIDKSHRLRTLDVWKQRHKNIDGDRNVSYYSDKRIDGFASSVIIVIGVVMLMAPIWILQAISNLQVKLAVISVFISIFLLNLSFAMVAKPFEALGATAAYAAVLMVFIQLGTGN